MMDPSSMATPAPMVQKRPFEDDDKAVARDIIQTKHGSSSAPNAASRQHSPATSATSSVLSMQSKTPSLSASLSGNHANDASTHQSKKRKLTFAEKQEAKDAKQREKQAKQADQEARKAARDEERRQRNEEAEEKRRAKEIEKEAKRQQKEAEQREKDEKKRREEEEKSKKERSQSRMTNFFMKPKMPLKPTGSVAPSDGGNSSSLPTDVPPNLSASNQDEPTPINLVQLSDYKRNFLPFHIKTDVVVAPANYHSWDEDALQHMERVFDTPCSGAPRTNTALSTLLDLRPLDFQPRGFVPPTTLRVMGLLDGSADNAVDLTKAGSPYATPTSLLKRIPMKILEFEEDVRPPYVGTNTKLRTAPELCRLARNPIKRTREELDYDYDSEAEWEEPEEGEDIMSEGASDSESELGAEEMDDFLDDEESDAHKPRKRLLNGDMDAVSSGLCFEDASGAAGQCAQFNFEEMRLEPLVGLSAFPIDPFNYSSEGDSQDTNAANAPQQAKSGAFFQRSPATIKSADQLKKPKLEGSDLARFKEFVVVQGKGLSKVALLGTLKRDFPNATGNVLKDTLETYAVSSSKRGANKTWEIVEAKSGAS